MCCIQNYQNNRFQICTATVVHGSHFFTLCTTTEKQTIYLLTAVMVKTNHWPKCSETKPRKSHFDWHEKCKNRRKTNNRTTAIVFTFFKIICRFGSIQFLKTENRNFQWIPHTPIKNDTSDADKRLPVIINGKFFNRMLRK